MRRAGLEIDPLNLLNLFWHGVPAAQAHWNSLVLLWDSRAAGVSWQDLLGLLLHSWHRVACDVDRLKRLAVGDVIERVRSQNQEISPFSGFK